MIMQERDSTAAGLSGRFFLDLLDPGIGGEKGRGQGV